MLGKKYERHTDDGDDGYTRWITPVMDGYKMACCDCGLVHDVDFRAVKAGRTKADGTFSITQIGKVRYRVALRVKRNNRATGQMRRRDKYKNATR